ncbi:MAG: hypothetical protein PHZ11_01155 [Desulfitobacteriaceae bacterium]|nr:hypothetical protein [Clostridia bacterium]MDD4345501.1 hypothetical protein [Desulfitobacteriaceae bacterium]MDD4400646.1 hypothetical protein [Desulfitobacteriaceae bacterium]
MFFKKYLKRDQAKNSTGIEQPVNTNPEVSEHPVSESSDDAADQSFFGSSRLFGKMKNWYSGPDMLYENEAWAPEEYNEYVGLFRKRRTLFEEQTSEMQTSEEQTSSLTVSD